MRFSRFARCAVLALAGAFGIDVHAGLYKCSRPDGSVTYQEDACPEGTELRDFGRDPANVSVVPFRMVPGTETRTMPRDKPVKAATERKSRLVIVDRAGRLVGVLSLVDLLEHARSRQALRTARAVLWREALGPRGGSAPGELLLRDDPVALALPPPSDEIHVNGTACKGGNHTVDLKEFPG